MSDRIDSTRGRAETYSNFSNGVPLTLPELARHALELSGGWPKVIAGTLCVPTRDGGLEQVKDADHLIAYISEFANVSWVRGGVTHDVLFRGLHRHVPEFRWATHAFHYPPIEQVMYLQNPPEPAANGYFDRLVDRFQPESVLDRYLLKAAFATPAANLPAGKRPVFVYTAGQQPLAQVNRGQGTGKSVVTDATGQLHGGAFQLDSGLDPKQVRSDLLSAEALGRTVLTLDNLKTNRFSSEFLEKLVTSPEWGGHRLYLGYGTRPNYTTLFVTVNGANFSKDLAQRAVVIRLGVPEYSAHWWPETEALIREHRSEIMADIGWFLTRTPAVPLSQFTRHPEWCQEVIARLPDPTGLIELIRHRQGEIDDDDRAAEDVVDHFASKLRAVLGHDRITSEKYFIPTGEAGKWLRELGRRYENGNVKHHLDQLAHPRLFAHRLSSARGCVWVGPDCPPDAEIRRLPAYGQELVEIGHRLGRRHHRHEHPHGRQR